MFPARSASVRSTFITGISLCQKCTQGKTKRDRKRFCTQRRFCEAAVPNVRLVAPSSGEPGPLRHFFPALIQQAPHS